MRVWRTGTSAATLSLLDARMSPTGSLAAGNVPIVLCASRGVVWRSAFAFRKCASAAELVAICEASP
jgi:hypothetical protein